MGTVAPECGMSDSSSSTASSVNGEERTGPGTGFVDDARSARITLDVLRAHFHQPIQTVATEFGMCVTRLKKLCRARGIERWPQRKVLSLNNMVRQLRAALAAPGFDRRARARTRAQLRIVLAKKRLLYADPNVAMAITPKTIFVLPPGCRPEPLGSEDGDEDEDEDEFDENGHNNDDGDDEDDQDDEEDEEEGELETAVLAGLRRGVPAGRGVLQGRKRGPGALPVPLVPRPPAPLRLDAGAVPSTAVVPTAGTVAPAGPTAAAEEGAGLSPRLRATGMDFDAYCAAAPQDIALLPPLTAYLDASPRTMAEARRTRVPLYFARAAGIAGAAAAAASADAVGAATAPEPDPDPESESAE